jgi:hypothetical protein
MFSSTGIPLSTTTISVSRIPVGAEYNEPYEDDQWDLIATAVPAVIDHPGGQLQMGGGQQNVAIYGLKCNTTDLTYLDLVTDETTGRTFRVQWLVAYPDHIEAQLYDTESEV